MRRLSQDDRQIIHRLLNAGFSTRDIGLLLNCTPANVRTSFNKYPEDPTWLPPIEYLNELGFKAMLTPDNQVRIEHPEGYSNVNYEVTAHRG
jgi:hypothetical protein